MLLNKQDGKGLMVARQISKKNTFASEPTNAAYENGHTLFDQEKSVNKIDVVPVEMVKTESVVRVFNEEKELTNIVVFDEKEQIQKAYQKELKSMRGGKQVEKWNEIDAKTFLANMGAREKTELNSYILSQIFALSIKTLYVKTYNMGDKTVENLMKQLIKKQAISFDKSSKGQKIRMKINPETIELFDKIVKEMVSRLPEQDYKQFTEEISKVFDKNEKNQKTVLDTIEKIRKKDIVFDQELLFSAVNFSPLFFENIEKIKNNTARDTASDYYKILQALVENTPALQKNHFEAKTGVVTVGYSPTIDDIVISNDTIFPIKKLYTTLGNGQRKTNSDLGKKEGDFYIYSNFHHLLGRLNDMSYVLNVEFASETVNNKKKILKKAGELIKQIADSLPDKEKTKEIFKNYPYLQEKINIILNIGSKNSVAPEIITSFFKKNIAKPVLNILMIDERKTFMQEHGIKLTELQFAENSNRPIIKADKGYSPSIVRAVNAKNYPDVQNPIIAQYGLKVDMKKKDTADDSPYVQKQSYRPLMTINTLNGDLEVKPIYLTIPEEVAWIYDRLSRADKNGNYVVTTYNKETGEENKETKAIDLEKIYSFVNNLSQKYEKTLKENIVADFVKIIEQSKIEKNAITFLQDSLLKENDNITLNSLKNAALVANNYSSELYGDKKFSYLVNTNKETLSALKDNVEAYCKENYAKIKYLPIETQDKNDYKIAIKKMINIFETIGSTKNNMLTKALDIVETPSYKKLAKNFPEITPLSQENNFVTAKLIAEVVKSYTANSDKIKNIYAIVPNEKEKYTKKVKQNIDGVEKEIQELLPVETIREKLVNNDIKVKTELETIRNNIIPDAIQEALSANSSIFSDEYRKNIEETYSQIEKLFEDMGEDVTSKVTNLEYSNDDENEQEIQDKNIFVEKEPDDEVVNSMIETNEKDEEKHADEKDEEDIIFEEETLDETDPFEEDLDETDPFEEGEGVKIEILPSAQAPASPKQKTLL